MGIDFKKLNDPAYQEEMRLRRTEREERERQMDEWRKITVGATGHRPDKMGGGWKNGLGGYDNAHPKNIELRTLLLEQLEHLIVERGKTRFVSGGALGFDTMFYWSVHALKKKYPHIENVVAVPFVNQHIRWSSEQVKWYHKMLETADTIVDVARTEDYSTHEDRSKTPIPLDSYSSPKMHKRNMFMVDQCSVLVAYYNGTGGGTAHAYNYAVRSFYRPNILRLDPRFDPLHAEWM